VSDDGFRPGYYKDHNGVWQKDRRAQVRRRGTAAVGHHDRRTMRRRKSDLEYLERETKLQIEEAMEELAAEHKPPEARDDGP
jgi:hypothetical protein